MGKAVDRLQDIGMIKFVGFVSKVDEGLNGFLFHDLSTELQEQKNEKNNYSPQIRSTIYSKAQQKLNRAHVHILIPPYFHKQINDHIIPSPPYPNFPMNSSEEDVINEQLNDLQHRIMNKIDDIRHALHEEDKAIVDEIVMKKSHSTEPIYPKYDKKVCYYQEFWKVYLLNEIMIGKIKDYSINNKQLHQDIHELDQAQKDWNLLWTQKSKKKIRRTSDMIEKTYQCPFHKCGRNYGSDVSLNLHMKIKHNSGTKTQRQALAKEICLAEEKGLKIKIDLNFPPGYLEEFRQNFKKQNNPSN